MILGSESEMPFGKHLDESSNNFQNSPISMRMTKEELIKYKKLRLGRNKSGFQNRANTVFMKSFAAGMNDSRGISNDKSFDPGTESNSPDICNKTSVKHTETRERRKTQMLMRRPFDLIEMAYGGKSDNNHDNTDLENIEANDDDDDSRLEV